MKHFTYTTKRRYCPSCGGDGMGRIFPRSPCWRCGGDGHLPGEPGEGEAHILLVHDQAGRLVDIRVVKGRHRRSIPHSLVFVALILAFAATVAACLYTAP